MKIKVKQSTLEANMTKICNIFGGPGSGKSTTAAGIFYKLKQRGVNVELVTEYAKDLTFEARHNVLEDQLYILAKQNRRIHRLIGQYDIVVTDSPILTGLVYTKPDYFKMFEPLLLEIWESYNNQCFLMNRGDIKYFEVGRNQKLDEAKQIDDRLVRFLNSRRIPYQEIQTGPNSVDEIIAALEID